MSLNLLLEPVISRAVHDLYLSEIKSSQIQLQKTRKEFEGDITLVLFPLLKIAAKSPEQTGNEIGQKLLASTDLVSGFNCVKGFLNLVISDNYWLNFLSNLSVNNNFGKILEGGSRKMVEYASPNTNKPLHLGHLRNIFLGNSVANLLMASGNPVVRTQIINDRGIHICKSMYAWLKFGNGETPESGNLKGDKLAGKYYVQFDKLMRSQSDEVIAKWENGEMGDVPNKVTDEYKKLKTALVEKDDEKARKTVQGKIRELANGQTQALRDAQEMLVKWEQGDKEVVALWKKMNGWVYEGFNQTYASMGVSFDKLYYESDTFITGKKMVADGLSKRIFFQKPDGSVWIDLTADGLDEKVVQRADGTAVYITQDIGTASQRMHDFPDLDGIVYTVGNEQDYHFKVLFLILEKLGYKWAQNCYHLSYGMVELRNSDGEIGKMKSREGTIVDADDLIDEVIDKARQMTSERGHIEGMTEDQKEKLYRMIALGGLKYFLLKVDPKKRMVFNPEESVDLNGNTGPFIQYVHARICSLVAKAGGVGSILCRGGGIALQSAERDVIRLLAEYPEVVAEAAQTYSPAVVANYCYELAKTYNTFFQSIPVMKAESDELRAMRVGLSICVAKVIRSGMELLGVEVPERM